MYLLTLSCKNHLKSVSVSYLFQEIVIMHFNFRQTKHWCSVQQEITLFFCFAVKLFALTTLKIKTSLLLWMEMRNQHKKTKTVNKMIKNVCVYSKKRPKRTTCLKAPVGAETGTGCGDRSQHPYFKSGEFRQQRGAKICCFKCPHSGKTHFYNN